MSVTVSCILIGAGGHASVLMDCLRQQGGFDVVGAIDTDPERWGTAAAGVSVIGGEDLLADMSRRGVTHFVLGLGGAGNNRPRQRVYERAIAAGLTPVTVVHPSTAVSSRARIGEGCQILPGAIVNAGAVLGANVIVNSGAIVEHDCLVGDHVHVATGARLAGAVTLEAGVHVGAGATVIQTRRVGQWAIVGAGAVVTHDVPAGVTVVGVPARPLARPAVDAGQEQG